MKSSRFHLLSFSVIALALVFLFTSIVQTVNASSVTIPPVDMRIMVESVNAASSTVVIKYMDKGTFHTYAIDGITQIKVNDTTGTFAQIKAGMQVRDSVERDSQTLDSISVSAADPGPEISTTTKPKKEKKPVAPDNSSGSNN